MKLISWIVVVVAILLAGCDSKPAVRSPAQEERERKFQLAVAGAITLRDNARDPDSFVVESAFVVKDTDALCYQYRARNGFGGMNRERAVIAIKSKKVAIQGSPGFVQIWNKECANKVGEEIDTVNTALKYARR